MTAHPAGTSIAFVRALLGLVIALAISCAPPSAAPASPTPTGPSGTPPAPGVTAPASLASSIRTAAVGALPHEFAYVGVSGGTSAHIWLVDLAGAGAAREVASWTFPPYRLTSDGLREVAFSASRDGRTIVFSAPDRSANLALYLLRTETGELRVLYDDPAADAALPSLAPAGERIAFSRLVLIDGAWVGDGLWLVGTDGAAPVRLVDPSSPSAPPIAVAWSPEGRELAFHQPPPEGLGPPPYDELALVDVANHGVRSLELRGEAHWKSREPRLLVTSSATATQGGTSEIWSYDTSTSSRRLLYRSAQALALIWSAKWHPTLERFLYVESTFEGEQWLWVRDVEANRSTRVPGYTSVRQAWWSSDGSRVYALVALPPVGQESEGARGYEVVDATAGRTIATLCRRAPSPPCP